MRRGAEPGGSAPRVLRGFLPCCAVSCRVASRLAALRRRVSFRVEWRGRVPPRDETQATPAYVIPHRVKPTPPLRAHNTTIQANFGMQGRCRFHLLEPQGTQGRCRFHLLEPQGTQGRYRFHLLEPQGTQGRYRFHTFPRVPSYGCVPTNLPWSRRHAAACRSALLGRGTTVAPLTCSRQPRPPGFRHLRGQEPHRHGPDRRARRGVQCRIG